MNTIILFLLLIFTATAHAVKPSRDGNLIPNPGFAHMSGGRVVGWSSNGPSGCCERVSGEGRSDDYSLRVSALHASSPYWVSDPLEVEGGVHLDFSAWMKTDRVTLGKNLWNKAVISAVFLDRSKRKIYSKDLVREEGTHGWIHYRKVVLPPVNASYMKVMLYLSHATGTAWFDDLSIVPLPRHVGKTFSRAGGGSEVELSIDLNGSRHPLGRVNGVFYEDPSFRYRGLAGLRPDVVRINSIAGHRYNLIRSGDRRSVKYNWDLLDRDVDKVVKMGAVPFLSVGWVPKQFEEEIRQGDYGRWKEMVFNVVLHYSKKYDVRNWYWNFWNEPSSYRMLGGRRDHVGWFGDEDEFHEFYMQTVDAALKANGNIKIGGAGFASGSPWLYRFIEWCGTKGVRLDFVSWHSYGSVPVEIGRKIAAIKDRLSRYASTKNAEMVIDEWSSYSESGANSRVDEYRKGVYAAAYRVAAISEMLAKGLSANIWFNMYENRFGVMAGGIKQPVYASFEALAEIGRWRVPVEGGGGDPYISSTATIDDNGGVAILLSYFKHFSDKSRGNDKKVNILIKGRTEATANYRIYEIVGGANPHLSEAGRSAGSTSRRVRKNARIEITMKPNSVMLVKVY